MASTEREFSDALHSIFKKASAIGYKPTAFLAMLGSHGAIETARRLVNAPQPSEGYTKLWEMGRLDLSVEAVIHDNPDFHSLFSETELERCSKRLSQYGYL